MGAAGTQERPPVERNPEEIAESSSARENRSINAATARASELRRARMGRVGSRPAPQRERIPNVCLVAPDTGYRCRFAVSRLHLKSARGIHSFRTIARSVKTID